MTSPLRKSTAFTLIELLVVIAILAILVVLILPSVSSATRRALAAKGVGNLKQIYAAFQLYAGDHDESYPAGDLGTDPNGGGGRGIIWLAQIYPYVSSSGDPTTQEWKALCTADAADGKYNSPPSKTFMDPLVSDDARLKKIASTTQDPIWGYGYNVFPFRGMTAADLDGIDPNNLRNTPWGSWSPYVFRLVKRTTVTFPSRRCLVGSANDWHVLNSSVRDYDRVAPGSAQVLYYDGHVSTVNKVQYDGSIDSPQLAL